MSQSFVLYSEWQVAGLDSIDFTKLGLHVPEFHSLLRSRLAWAVADILHDLYKEKVKRQPYSVYISRLGKVTRHCGHSHRLSQLLQFHLGLLLQRLWLLGYMRRAPVSPTAHPHCLIEGSRRRAWAPFHPGGFQPTFTGFHLLRHSTSHPSLLPTTCLAASGSSNRSEDCVTHSKRSNLSILLG